MGGIVYLARMYLGLRLFDDSSCLDGWRDSVNVELPWTKALTESLVQKTM